MARVRAPAAGSVAPLGLAAIVAVVFARSIGHGFVRWDDHGLIVDNPAFRGLGWPELSWMASNVLLGHYVPVTWLSFALDYVVWGLDPAGYHLTNVLLHAVNAALVYTLAARLLGGATAWPVASCRLAAGVAALLWALHPLRVEAVSWVTARRDVLSALFLLLALSAYLRAAQPEQPARRTWLVLAMAAYALALGSKAVVMALAPALVALEVYPLGGLPRDPRRWAGRRYRAVWGRIAPFAALAALAAIVAYVGQSRGSGVRVLEVDRWLGKLLGTLVFHVERTLVPIGLSPLYELPARMDFGLAQRASALAVLALTGAAVALWRRWPAGLVAWIWYTGFLAPVTAIAHAGPQLTADRYGYLPTLALSVLAGAGMVALARRIPGRRAALALGAPLLAALIALAGATWRQQGAWRDSGTLWAHAVRATPGCVRCHVNLGNWLSQEDGPAAIAHYEHALALDPSRVELHANVGLVLARLGRVDEAIARYERVLARHPDRLGVRVSLVTALLRAGRLREGVARLDEAGRFGAAPELVDYFRRLASAQPAAPVPRLGLVQAHARAGDAARARDAHRALAALHPELALLVAPALPAAGAGGPGPV